MKRLNLFGMGLGATALLASGSVLAAPPSGHAFNDWTATAGVITLNACAPPACVVLLNEVGMMQARVRADNDPNAEGFFQTINVEETASGAAAALDFTNEAFVSASAGGFPVAAYNRVDLDGDGVMTVELAFGAMQAPGESEIVIWQENVLGGYGQNDFAFEDSGSGTSLRIDQNVNNVGANRGTALTVRATSGSFTTDAGNLELVDGTLVAYSAGDAIRTVWGQGELWNLGPMHASGTEHRIFEIQSVANTTTAESAQWTNTNDQVDDTGIGFVNFMAAWENAYNLNNNLWNGNFGTVPNAADGVLTVDNLDAANVPFPDFPDHDPNL